jgi:hypothetical protein
MAARIMLFAAILFVALSAGLALGHALQWAHKRRLPPGTFLEVQQALYVSYGPAAGLLEMGSLAACIGTLSMAGTAFTARIVVSLSLATLVVMFLVWAILIRPINVTVSAWRPDTLPDHWVSKGVDKWHVLHAVRLVLAIFALACLVWTAIWGNLA